jgi:hypothetical protein
MGRVDECHLAEDAAGAEALDDLALDGEFNLARLNNEHLVALLPGAEEHGASRKGCARWVVLEEVGAGRWVYHEARRY